MSRLCATSTRAVASALLSRASETERSAERSAASTFDADDAAPDAADDAALDAERTPLYEKYADFIVNCDEGTLAENAEKIARTIALALI